MKYDVTLVQGIHDQEAEIAALREALRKMGRDFLEHSNAALGVKPKGGVTDEDVAEFVADYVKAAGPR